MSRRDKAIPRIVLQLAMRHLVRVRRTDGRLAVASKDGAGPVVIVDERTGRWGIWRGKGTPVPELAEGGIYRLLAPLGISLSDVATAIGGVYGVKEAAGGETDRGPPHKGAGRAGALC